MTLREYPLYIRSFTFKKDKRVYLCFDTIFPLEFGICDNWDTKKLTLKVEDK